MFHVPRLSHGWTLSYRNIAARLNGLGDSTENEQDTGRCYSTLRKDETLEFIQDMHKLSSNLSFEYERMKYVVLRICLGFFFESVTGSLLTVCRQRL